MTNTFYMYLVNGYTNYILALITINKLHVSLYEFEHAMEFELMYIRFTRKEQTYHVAEGIQ